MALKCARQSTMPTMLRSQVFPTLYHTMAFSQRKVIQKCTFHLYSIWLFTFSDLKTILIPSTAFGILNGTAFSLSTPSIRSPSQILLRTPLIILWVWLNLLPFTIANQRQPAAIDEDLINKPWRTMPSRRLSPEAAKRLMLVLYAGAIILSLILGAASQSLALVALGYWYNELRGADANCIVRNLINGCGFICFSSGAMQVALGADASAIQLLWWWFIVIAGIVMSTVQSQDMYDQRGDAVRGRKTVPLVLGDGLARWSIAVPMSVWCWLCPWLWRSSILGYVLPVVLGVIVIVRTLRERSEKEDRVTFRWWNLWLVSVYLLPLIKAIEMTMAAQIV